MRRFEGRSPEWEPALRNAAYGSPPVSIAHQPDHINRAHTDGQKRTTLAMRRSNASTSRYCSSSSDHRSAKSVRSPSRSLSAARVISKETSSPRCRTDKGLWGPSRPSA